MAETAMSQVDRMHRDLAADGEPSARRSRAPVIDPAATATDVAVALERGVEIYGAVDRHTGAFKLAVPFARRIVRVVRAGEAVVRAKLALGFAEPEDKPKAVQTMMTAIDELADAIAGRDA